MASAQPAGSSEEKDISYYLSFPGTVQIFIGEEHKCWTLNKKLLCARSGYFRAAFRGGFEEANGVLILEDHDPEIFTYIVNWMYSKDPSNIEDSLDPCDMESLDLLKVYIMANRFSMELLKYAVMDHLREWLGSGSDMEPAICDVEFVYENTASKDDPARKYLVDATIDSIFQPFYPDPDHPGELLDRASFHDLSKCNLEFSSELLIAIQGYLLRDRNICRKLQRLQL